MGKLEKAIIVILVIVLLGAGGFCLYNILSENDEYKQAQSIYDELHSYGPDIDLKELPSSDTDIEEAVKKKVNLLDNLQNAIDNINYMMYINSDVVGWIYIPNTMIDYPIVQSEDNSYYLYRAANKADAISGSIFMDCRCKSDFTSFNSIVYGHNMVNGAMFGLITYFKDKDFFEENTQGLLITRDKVYVLDFFACCVASADSKIFEIPHNEKENLELLEYIKSKSVNSRDMDILPTDNIISLSTCSYEYGDARTVLFGKLNLLYGDY